MVLGTIIAQRLARHVKGMHCPLAVGLPLFVALLHPRTSGGVIEADPATLPAPAGAAADTGPRPGHPGTPSNRGPDVALPVGAGVLGCHARGQFEPGVPRAATLS